MTLQSLRKLIFRKLQKKRWRDLASTMLLFTIQLLKIKYAICLVFFVQFIKGSYHLIEAWTSVQKGTGVAKQFKQSAATAN